MSPTPRGVRRFRAGLFFAGLVYVSAAGVEPVAVPRFNHPGAGQTFYFVLTDRFANGDRANDTGGHPGGPGEHGFDPTKISHYQGGDIAGLIAHLDYLRDLGVTAVWVTPPFRNKPMQQGTAGYHGYWTLDFTQIDPHLGTNDEFRRFIGEAHARGMRVFMDIITNHTADVIQYRDGSFTYRPIADAPYRDAAGAPFKLRDVAYNGLGDPAAFPELDAERSFALVPAVAENEANAKTPAWLNDITLYHNRGNTTFLGENSVHGDFVGLDDLFTEHPRVVHGLIEVFSEWLVFGIDGFRIDTVRHVNNEFWQAFSPAIRARARELGRPDFLQFAEVYNDAGDPAVLAEFSTNVVPIDTTIDFGFFAAARRYVSQGGTSAALTDFFVRDDYYTDHDSNVHSTTTFLGNHDAGRFAFFLREDNTGASDELLADLVRFGHGLLYLSRGQPVLYYGDEQGMIGRGGNDQQARESMFASVAPAFRDASLLATTRTGSDDKFDRDHPFYRFFSALGRLRAEHVALRTGAMIPRFTAEPNIFAFSRIDRGERVEYLAVFNNSRTQTVRAAVGTSQPAGAQLLTIFNSHASGNVKPTVLVADADGRATVELAPLQFIVWRAVQPLAATGANLAVVITNPLEGGAFALGSRDVDGLTFPLRREIRAEVAGGDGVGEMTFTLRRASRPAQLDYLGTDDNAPYRVFWSPPADIAAGESLEIIATFDDLRGSTASAGVGGLSLKSTTSAQGIAGSRTPAITTGPRSQTIAAGSALTLSVAAEGSGDLEYQWLHDGARIAGANSATYTVESAAAAHSGAYRVLVHNLAGTAVSDAAHVIVEKRSASGARTIRHSAFPSAFVAARNVDVWLPPGYDAGARYPVIYMHDGQNLFDPATSFGGVPWSVDEALERMIASGRTRGAIVVGVWNTPARFAEYMPRKPMSEAAMMRYGENLRVPIERIQSDQYLKFLVTELKPFIDRTYRTETGPRDTLIMGSSMGGLISAYALVEYPAVFGGAGCVSTHWPAGEGGVVDYVAAHLPPAGSARMYFDHGTGTLDASYEAHQFRLDQLLRDAGWVEERDWITRRFPGAEHSEKFWRERVEIPLAFLLGAGE